MNLNDFRQLEDKVVKPDYNKDYKGLNYVLRGLSIFGNFISIFLASFFVSQLLEVATDNIYVIWTITLILLGGLELLKRELFFRFSRDFIRTNDVFNKSVLPMLIFVCILVSLSFYSSLSGANEISSKSNNLIAQTDSVTNTLEDSLTISFNNNKAVIDSEIVYYKSVNAELNIEKNKKREKQNSTTSITRKRTIGLEIEAIDKDMNRNDEYITKAENKIKELEEKRKTEIEEVSAKITGKVGREIDKNKSDSVIFIIISTLIEFLILIGIYFGNLYNFRSYRDVKYKLLHNKDFKEFFDYMNIIDCIYLNRKESDITPPINIIKKLLISHKIYMTDDEILYAIDLLEQLMILKKNEEHMWIAVERKEAEAIINKHFHIS